MLVKHYQTTDSTSTQAARLASEKPGQVILVHADRQTSGRGRQGRNWQSPEGGAWFSLVWPTQCDPNAMQAAPLLVGHAVGDVIASLGLASSDGSWSNSLRIKWPNDLLIENKKAVGILCEQVLSAANSNTPPPTAMILGVGINANIDIASLDGELRQPVISLKDVLGFTLDIHQLIQDCADRIAHYMRQLETNNGLDQQTVLSINKYLAWQNQLVSLQAAGNEKITGTLCGVDSLGQIILDTSDGQICHSSGEIGRLTKLDP